MAAPLVGAALLAARYLASSAGKALVRKLTRQFDTKKGLQKANKEATRLGREKFSKKGAAQVKKAGDASINKAAAKKLKGMVQDKHPIARKSIKKPTKHKRGGPVQIRKRKSR